MTTATIADRIALDPARSRRTQVGAATAAERRLLRCAHQGDASARDELIRHFTPLAHRLAARYRATGESRDDLEQVAYLGLIKAIDRYDPGRGPFLRYAVPTIIGELKRHFRDKGWAHARAALAAGARAEGQRGHRRACRSTSAGRPTPRDARRAHRAARWRRCSRRWTRRSAYTPAALDAPSARGEERRAHARRHARRRGRPLRAGRARASRRPAFRSLPAARAADPQAALLSTT